MASETPPNKRAAHVVCHRVDRENVLELAMGDAAASWIGRKAFALSDDAVQVRLGYEEMLCEVTYRSQWLGWLLGAPCFLFGLFALLALQEWGGAAGVAVGLSLILFGRKRRVITISGAPEGRFRWKAPVIFDRKSRLALDRVLANIAEFAAERGARVKWVGPRPPAIS